MDSPGGFHVTLSIDPVIEDLPKLDFVFLEQGDPRDRWKISRRAITQSGRQAHHIPMADPSPLERDGATSSSDDTRSTSPQHSWEPITASLLSASTSAILLLTALWYCQFGFDMRDEGFYLVSLSDPIGFPLQLSLFPRVLWPIWQLCGRDMVLARWLNVGVIFGLSIVLSFLVVKRFRLTPPDAHRQTWVLAAALATASLAWLSEWRPTPNYNTLTFITLLVTMIVLITRVHTSKQNDIANGLLLGGAGWLCWMAKLSSGSILAVCLLSYFAVDRRHNGKIIVIAATTALTLLWLSAVSNAGSVERFIERMGIALELVRNLGSGHTLERLFRVEFFVPAPAHILVFACGAAVSFAALRGPKTSPGKKLAAGTMTVATVLTSLATITLVFHLDVGQPSSTRMVAMLAWGSGLGVLVAVGRKRLTTMSRSTWAVAGFLFVSPDIYAVGTRGPYHIHGSGVALFWLLAAAVMCRGMPNANSRTFGVTALGLFAQCTAAMSLHTGIHTPPQQSASLTTNSSELVLTAGTIPVRLRPEHAAYFEDIRRLAQSAGVTPDTAIIDLTGRSPGVLHALGVRSAGRAWMIGSYSGSDEYAAASLDFRSCHELVDAWVLTEPEGMLSISTWVLSRFGAQLERDYIKMGIVESPAGIDRMRYPVVQELWRPRNPPAPRLHECRVYRDHPSYRSAYDAQPHVPSPSALANIGSSED